MRIHTEVAIAPPSGYTAESERELDLALVRIDSHKIPRTIGIIAQFEFKYKVLYSQDNVERDIRWDIRRLGDGNDEWTIVAEEGETHWPARTEYSFFCLVADDWDRHIRGSSKSPNNHGILHSNGTYRYSKPTNENPVPRIGEQKTWLMYVEMHGPYSEEPDDEDWKKWGVFRVDSNGKRHVVHELC